MKTSALTSDGKTYRLLRIYTFLWRKTSTERWRCPRLRPLLPPRMKRDGRTYRRFLYYAFLWRRKRTGRWRCLSPLRPRSRVCLRRVLVLEQMFPKRKKERRRGVFFFFFFFFFFSVVLNYAHRRYFLHQLFHQTFLFLFFSFIFFAQRRRCRGRRRHRSEKKRIAPTRSQKSRPCSFREKLIERARRFV